MSVYKVTKLATPLHTSGGNHATKRSVLSTEVDYVVFSREMATFGFMSLADYSKCKETDYICDKPDLMLNQPSDDCVYNLFVNHKIVPSCVFNTVSIQPLPNAIKIGKSQFLFQNTKSSIRISCRGKPDNFYDINSHSILEIACGCSAHADSFSIRADLEDCKTEGEPVKISYPINVAQFQNTDLPKFINVSTSARQVVKTQPRLFDEIKSKLNLPQLEIGDDVPLVDRPPVDDYFVPTFKADFSEIISLAVTFLWNSALTAAIVIMFLRYRAACTMIMAAQAVTPTEAFMIRPNMPQAKEDQLVTDMDMLTICISIITAIIVICTITKLIFSPPIVGHIWKPNPLNQEARLYIKIFDAQNTILVRLCTIPLDNMLKYTSIPSMQRFFVTYDPLPKVNLVWSGDLSFVFQGASQTIPMPSEVVVSLQASLLLQNINSSQFLTFYALLFKPSADNEFHHMNKISE